MRMLDFVLPSIKFFEPTPDFLTWAGVALKDYVIFDCGAGTGWLGEQLKTVGVKCLGLDLLERDTTYSPVITGIDTTEYKFPAAASKRMAIIARPNRGLWIQETIDNCVRQGLRVMYIGIPSHFEEDLEGRDWEPVFESAGAENETAFLLK